eukprot:PRCOL_00004467-RA
MGGARPKGAAGGADHKQGGWTSAEDKMLAELQGKLGNRWSAVAQHMPGRTGQQCAQRWRHKVNPIIRKDKWTEEEDQKLADLHKEYGNKWAEIARRLEGRTDQQCMGRWRRHLDPSIKKEAWAKDEDQLLLGLHKQHGSSWALISQSIEGRTAQQCRARYFQMQCWDADRPNKASSQQKQQQQKQQQATGTATGQGVQGQAKQDVTDAMNTLLATPNSIHQMAAALATYTPGSLLGQQHAAALWSQGMFPPPSAGAGGVSAGAAGGGAGPSGTAAGAGGSKHAAGAGAAGRGGVGILRPGAPPTPSAVLSTPGTGHILNHLLGLPSDSPPTPPNLFNLGDPAALGGQFGHFTPPDGAGGAGGGPGTVGSGGSGGHRLSLDNVSLPRSLDESPGTGSTPGSTGKTGGVAAGAKKRPAEGRATENVECVGGSPENDGAPRVKRARGGFAPAELTRHGVFATPAVGAKTASVTAAAARAEEDVSPDALLPRAPGSGGSVDETRSRMYSLLDSAQ